MPTSRQGYRTTLTGFLCLAGILFSAGVAGSTDHFSTRPVTNNGKRWNIGYYEGGPYINYPTNLKAIAEALIQMGWLPDINLDDGTGTSDSKRVWNALSRAKSPYLHFDHQAYHSAGWDQKRRRIHRAAVIDQLQLDQLDFIIAMGLMKVADEVYK